MIDATLVFIPGVMCDESFWAAPREHLRALVTRSAVADHGRADTLAAMARSILAHHEGPLVLLGHSMGGRVALELARQARERVLAMALLDTGYRALAPGEAGAREVEGRMRLVHLARREGVRAMAHEWVQGMVHPARLHDRVLIESIVEMFARYDAEHFAAQMQALIARPDAGEVLAGLTCPVQLLCGEQDVWSPPSQHREMAALTRFADFESIADAGHMIAMEQPQAATQALCRWLHGRVTSRPR